ncbi:galactonate dehydratase [Seonamhaeicola maritimus]|uniref:galactonate dehydratase n=1 Tax=Seonamhaeicola maritimus TaxID=2591822 RepID=UPI0024951E3F|nr:galactonate dehydratase [Seonamhaeicola maritimus]
MNSNDKTSNHRRKFLKNTIASVAAASVGIAGLGASNAKPRFKTGGPINPNDKIKITKVETFVLKNSWVFIKISTDAGITGWGEMLKDDAKACAAGALEIGNSYLIGKDPRPVTHHWQAIHRGAFYRGGPIKTAISSGIDQALWDITGKCFGVPAYKLMGGPTRDKVLVYGTKPDYSVGLKAIKVGPKGSRTPFKYTEGKKMVDEVVERFAALRAKHPDLDVGIDFHGAVQPTTASLLIEALEPHRPWFYEEVVQALNVDVMADLAKKTHIPFATGERVFTKWGFREILEKGAAMILQPDVNYAGGITELKIIAGMAEAYYAPIAPHNPNGPCSLAASLQIAACVPNFMVQERGNREHDLLKVPLEPVVDGYRPIPKGPGLGITIDEDKLMDQVGEPKKYGPRFDKDDNSVIDW